MPDKNFAKEDDIPNFDKVLKETPLEVRVKVTCWFFLNDIIHKAGAREEKSWNMDEPNDKRLWDILSESTKELTEHIMTDIKEWENDGKAEQKKRRQWIKIK